MLKGIIRIVALIGAFMFVGCGSRGPDISDPNTRRAISSVKEYSNLQGVKYTRKGYIDSRYCVTGGAQYTHTMMGNISKDGTILEMKSKAQKLGANGIANIMCKEDGIHFKTNCNNSINCFGEAILVSRH